MTRIYIEQPLQIGAEIELDVEAARHAIQVLRLKAGDPITVFNGKGGEYSGIVSIAKRREATVRITDFDDSDRESQIAITVLQSVSRGERMDFSIQKAVELGVTRIVPIITARTTVRLDGERAEKRAAHWAGVIRHACEQSGRNRIPELLPVCRLSDALDHHNQGQFLVFDPSGDEVPGDLDNQCDLCTVAIGPEGGFDLAELDQFSSAGFRRIRLGPRILRTETATVVALSFLQLRYGDFG